MACSESRDRPEEKDGVPQIEVTPEMIEAGSNRLADLLEAEVGLAYAAEEVFLAMVAAARQDG